MWLEKLGGRKFVLALISLILGTGLAIHNPAGLTPELVGLILGVVGTFGISNAVVTTKAMGMPSAEEAPPVAATAALEERVIHAEIRAHNAESNALAAVDALQGQLAIVSKTAENAAKLAAAAHGVSR